MKLFHSFSTDLLFLILLISLFFSLVFKIGLVFLLIGSHLISHLAVRPSQSMIPSLDSLVFLRKKIPTIIYYFIIILTPMTPNCTLLPFYKFCFISWTLSLTFTRHIHWMNLNKLFLNQSKTAFLLIGTKQHRLKLSDLIKLSLSNYIISVCHQARLQFDSDMSFFGEINFVTKSRHFRIQYSSFSFSFYSLSSCKFTSWLQQSWLLQFIYTLASHKQISTNFNAFKIHWNVS